MAEDNHNRAACQGSKHRRLDPHIRCLLVRHRELNELRLWTTAELKRIQRQIGLTHACTSGASYPTPPASRCGGTWRVAGLPVPATLLTAGGF